MNKPNQYEIVCKAIATDDGMKIVPLFIASQEMINGEDLELLPEGMMAALRIKALDKNAFGHARPCIYSFDCKEGRSKTPRPMTRVTGNTLNQCKARGSR
ncbi:hypothetical protein [Pseudoxanthomonas mexicana]